MSKRTIKLEFEFAARKYVEQKNGVEGIEYSIKPVTDHDFWSKIFKDETVLTPTLRSLASVPEDNSLSIIAMQFKDVVNGYAKYHKADIEPSKIAVFHAEDGTEKQIKPAVFTPH